MKRFVSLFIAVLFLLGAVAPAVAQGPEGGIIIEGNFGGDPGTFNPLLCSDTSCGRITGLLFPGSVGVDPVTANHAPVGENPRVRAATVTNWDISEDGTVYTLTFRDDYFWTDGTPVTAYDYQYTWDAIVSGEVDTNQGYFQDVIASIEAVDAQTAVVTLHEPDCAGLLYISYVQPLPAHVLGEDFAAINDSPFNFEPNVSAGPFTFGQFRSGELVSLLANENYADAELGYVNSEGFIYKAVPDQTVEVEQFLAGETNLVGAPPVNRRSDIRAAGEAGDVQVYPYPGNSWDYMAFNLANPENPQPGLDEAGNVIPQEPHPLFGDVRVRQAIAHAVDVDSIIDGAVFGEGSRMSSVYIPSSWAYDDTLEPIPYDPDAAAAMLAEAGWVDIDDDGVLEAQGAMYAEDGTEFSFVLYTNEGNTRRAAIATVIQDQLSQIGIAVDFQSIDFNTLLDVMYGQAYDAFILGWRNGYPDDPDLTQLFSVQSDLPGSGDNFTSYYNERVAELLSEARRVPGCAIEDRAELYKEVQALMQEDLPYLWLFTQDGMYAARSSVENFDPYPSNLMWNVDMWAVTP
ncbi:MAG: hypothetical protein JXN59_11780 [Anaerolineae bacterium]|nr:hypothetical protein [Anaerolineae bacterium]